MNMFMEFFLFFVSILQFLFPFAFKDTEVPVQTTAPVVEETVMPGEHVHTGGNGNCLQSAVCEICGETYGGEGNHAYTVTVKPATCTQGGFTTYRCRFCLHTEEGDYTEPKGHNYQKKTTTATCVVAGYNIFTCTSCSASYNELVEPAKGHDYESETFSANCTEGFRTVYKCKTCRHTYIEQSDDAIGHDYDEIITAATCTQGGYTTFTCKVCGESHKGVYTPARGHKFTNYVSDGNASCSSNGTKTAYCDNGCNTKDPIIDENTMLPHKDENPKDTLCDICHTKIHVNYTYLQYPAAALAGVNVNDFIKKADADYKGSGKGDEYSSNEGVNYNGIMKSPYFTAKVTGKLDGAETVTTTEIPVYGANVFVGETQKGALHSFSEIYIKEGEPTSFEIEITGNTGYITINNAVILPASAGETATVTNGTVKAVISGFGTHTFLFNNENQAYAYTVTVRALVDDNWAIDYLRNEGYTVTVVEGYKRADFERGVIYDPQNVNAATIPLDQSLVHWGTLSNKHVLYLKRGAYLAVDHRYDIMDPAAEKANPESLTLHGTTKSASDVTGISQNRYGALTINSADDVQILGYGAIDLNQLDRAERRGAIISWSNNVHIQGIKLINSPQWTFVVYNCNNVYIRDVDVFGYRQNSDAFDICNSRDVTVEGCFARTGDDGFVVKTLGGDDNAVTNNVTVRNCYAWIGKARAFGIFGETFKNISNVYFEDNTVLFHDATWNYLRIPAIGVVIEDNAENSGTDTYRRRLSNIVFDGIEICRNEAAAMHCIIYDKVNYYTIDGIKFKNISYEKMNRMMHEDNEVTAFNVINTFSAGAVIEQNAVVENIVCGGTRVTLDNYGQYFDYNTLHYCNGVIK